MNIAENAVPKKQRNGRRPAAFIDDPLWYKDAVIYQLHVKSFYDANGDGIGDFAGLIDKLDYIAGLGVNTIWLLPFYPSPRRDDGYDIAEYKAVHRDYGSMADAKRFIAAAHQRGLRVITELVINHTSDQHPWFQRARRAKPGSAARNFYVWSDTDQKYLDTRIIFCDTEKSNWTWDPVAGAYFWHRFYSHQPDLNFDNPQVMKAVLSVMRYWLDLGVDGLRLDAVPYLIEREGTSNENLAETHDILKRIRAEIDEHYPDRMLIAEANMWPEDTQQYFGSPSAKADGGGSPSAKTDGGGSQSGRAGEGASAAARGDGMGVSRIEATTLHGDECHMAFHFPLMPRMYMALAQEDRFPVTDILRQTPDIPANCQWAIFLRNHDELTLEMVTDKERDYLWDFYASDRRARINLGIRRRLAPLMERDRRRVELLNSLLLSMPGTPVIYYGDEIGMGDNIHLGDRDGVRTPMQWSVDRNGGFSRADTASLVLPPIMDPLYGFQAVNVEAQSRDAHSLLNWTRRMLAVRKQQKAFGRGSLKLLYPRNRRILAYLREYSHPGGETETILCVANVSRSAQAVELDLSSFAGRVPVEMVGGSAFPPIGQLPYLLTFPPYGFHWFLLAAEARLPSWHTPAPEPLPDLHTLVLRKDVSEILEQPARGLLEREVLPNYLPKRRWFGAKNEKLLGTRIAEAIVLPDTSRPILLTEIEVRTDKGVQRYLLPLGFVPESDIVTALPQQLSLARVRRGRHVGFLTDAFTLDALARGILDHLRKATVLQTSTGRLCFLPTSRMQELEIAPDAEIRRVAAEQSNSSLVIGDKAILKLIRHLAGGQHPEAEMGRALTDRGYRNIAPMLGEVTRIEADGRPQVLAVVQGFMHNQGDAWAWTLNVLERVTRDLAQAGSDEIESADRALHELLQFAGVLGRRLGEMHRTLAEPSDDPAFAPEAAGEVETREWGRRVGARVDEACAALRRVGEWTDPAERELAQILLSRRESLRDLASALAARGTGSLRIRIHGDFHLGQVLVAQGDAYLIDFEGEPLLTLAERRQKTSPYRDVGGLLRSLDYAAAVALSQAAPPPAEVMALREALDARYRRASEQAFLDEYRAATSELNARQDPQRESALIDLFTLEKAAYEIAYEAANRPAWIGVPLRGLAAIAERLLAEDANGRG